MRFGRASLAIITIIGAVQTGCTLVGLEPEAESVRVLDPAAAANCQIIGKTRVKVLGKVGFVSRNPEKVMAQLDILARNEGQELSGNAVTPAGPVENGSRSYQVLRCPSAP